MEQQKTQPPREVKVYAEKTQPTDSGKQEKLPLAASAVDPLEEEEQLVVQNG